MYQSLKNKSFKFKLFQINYINTNNTMQNKKYVHPSVNYVFSQYFNNNRYLTTSTNIEDSISHKKENHNIHKNYEIIDFLEKKEMIDTINILYKELNAVSFFNHNNKYEKYLLFSELLTIDIKKNLFSSNINFSEFTHLKPHMNIINEIKNIKREHLISTINILRKKLRRNYYISLNIIICQSICFMFCGYNLAQLLKYP